MQIRDLLLQSIVLVGHVVEHLRDLVQPVEPFQDLVAAGLLLGHDRLALVYRLDGLVDASVADGLTLVVGDCQDDAPVHPAGDVGLAVPPFFAVRFGICFAAGPGLDLLRLGAVLYQEVADGVGAGEAEFLVGAVRTDAVGMAFDAHTIPGILTQQLGEP